MTDSLPSRGLRFVLVSAGSDAGRALASVAAGLVREPETRAAGGDHVEAVRVCGGRGGGDVIVVGERRASGAAASTER
jgi:hypothetical protein